MSGLQSKCVFVSATMHGLLLALLVVSSAFVKPPPKIDEDVKFIKMFPAATLTDDETSGGGNPNVSSTVAPSAFSPQPAAAPDPAPPFVEPPVSKPEPVKVPEVKRTPEPVEKPKPKEPTQKPVVKAKPPETRVAKLPDPKKAEPKKVDIRKEETKKPEPVKPPKHEIVPVLVPKKAEVDPEIERRKIEQARREQQQKIEREERFRAERAEREERLRAAAEERQRNIANQMAIAEGNARARRQAEEKRKGFDAAFGNFQKNLSGGMPVEMPGPGGAAFLNYAEVIWTRYYQAWQTPESGGSATVRVEIVVARDGNILSAQIISKSGNAALDNSVRQAIERVRTLPPFPEGAPDERRHFKINFNLEAKRPFG